MAKLTDFRNAVGTAIQDLIDIEIRPGKFDGKQINGPVGCIYPRQQHERSNVLEQIYEVRVRVFLKWDPSPNPDSPIDPTPLEEIVERIQASLSADDQSFAQSVWFARLTEAEYNMAWNAVEMSFMAVGWNAWAVAEPEV